MNWSKDVFCLETKLNHCYCGGLGCQFSRHFARGDVSYIMLHFQCISHLQTYKVPNSHHCQAETCDLCCRHSLKVPFCWHQCVPILVPYIIASVATWLLLAFSTYILSQQLCCWTQVIYWLPITDVQRLPQSSNPQIMPEISGIDKGTTRSNG